ncbi:MAG: response regulator [Clostridia bacterium]|nr:response regulator [Clostridia bacterium]
MYRTILVDDEAAVLDGLRRHVDWKSRRLSVEGAFSNGRDAFAYLSQNAVDLIITDVRMPYMDGIELVKRAREIYPGVKILFISGHADVAYLRDALKLDAVDYILKSIDLEELDRALERVVGLMDAQRKKSLRFSEMEQRLSENMPILRNNRLTMLLRDEFDESGVSAEDVARDLRFLGIPLDDGVHYAVMVMQTVNRWVVISDMTERERYLFDLKIVKCCEEILLNYGGVCFMDRQNEFVLIVNAENEDCEEDFLTIAQQLRASMSETFGMDVTIGISDRFSGLRRIRAAFQSACEAIRKGYLLDDGLPISVNKYEEVGNIKDARERAQREISQAITSGDADAVHAALERALSDMRAMESEDERENFMIFLLLLPTGLLTDLETGEKGSYASQRRLMERFLLCRDRQEQTSLLTQSYCEVTGILARRSAPWPSALIRRITQTISQQYMNHLSVSTLAQSAYLSPTYMCVLFKQQTGKTVNEYITIERIKQAKRLLADPNILLYDVCYKVGYLSPSYFSKLFKKMTGQTPGEYRDEICSARKPAGKHD